MARSIEMAINKLNEDLNEVRGTRTFSTAIETYLEAVFHQKVDHGEFKYFSTLIELSHIDEYDSIVITRYDDGCRYVWKMAPACPDIPNYHSDYVDGFFNSTDCDEYVSTALWQLLEILYDHGMARYKKDLLSWH